MKLTIALLLASLPFLAVGGESLYHAALSRQQVTLTCDQLAAEPPRTSWLTITGCQLGDDVRFQEAGGQITELLIPVRRVGQLQSEPAMMIAATSHAGVLGIAQEALGGVQPPGDEARSVMMLRILTALDAAPQIQGYVRRGLLHMMPTRNTLAAVDVPLTPDAVILDLNARPQFLVPGLLFGAGVLLLLSAVARLLRPESEAPAAAVPAEAPVQPASASHVAAPLSTDARFRGLMLLNLEPASGREAIEQAPPLGPREQVEQQIARAIQGIAFDARGRGTLTSDGRSVTIDLGADAVAWTGVLDARGPGAGGLLRALVSATGWRLYHPRRGVFLDPADLE